MMRIPASSDSYSAPWIFLSHSGKQKADFAKPLYQALLQANHRPFFDLDIIQSLSAGDDYPPRIFQACRDCKMGVVVLSKDYVQSLWPMMELEQLLRDRRIIYPVFYDLNPGDLSNPDNLKNWKKVWEELAAQHNWQSRMEQLQNSMSSRGWPDFQINLDLSSWADSLAQIKERSGTVRTVGQSDCELVLAVQSTICARLPPPQMFYLDDGIKGVGRMKEIVSDAFSKLGGGSIRGDWACTIGIYGIGGSGKTTLCKAMVNFFGGEFPGRCFYLEFPSNDNDVAKLLPAIKDILTTLSCRSPPDGSDIDAALSFLVRGLEINDVFLAIDNVWEKSFDNAKKILLMKGSPNSKILVTGRSKELVTCLLQSRADRQVQCINESVQHSDARPNVVVLRVPSLNEAEAMETLKSYSCFSREIPEDCLRSLARSCFFDEQCHPFYLWLKGIELRRSGRACFNDQQWRDLISKAQFVHGDTNEEAVMQLLGKSLEEWPLHVQEVFIDIATCKLLRSARGGYRYLHA